MMKRIGFTIAGVLVLLGLTWYLSTNNPSTTINRELTEFAVQDTGAISKIFMADEKGESVLLERTDRGWMLNGEIPARQDAINILLYTMHRLKVKMPVSQTAMESTLKSIAASHTKVEIYKGGSDPEKVYFVGGPTKDHTGTNMLLEIDGERSSRPFVMHIEGFHGFLTPRYFTNANEWRQRQVFAYDYGELQSVTMTVPGDPSKNFKIVDAGDHETFELYIGADDFKPAKFDTSIVKAYLSSFKKLHFESLEETKSEAFIDSVTKSLPMNIITATAWDGSTSEAMAFLKPLPGGTDPEGNPIEHDFDRFYIWIDQELFVVAQYSQFDKILQHPRIFFRPNR